MNRKVLFDLCEYLVALVILAVAMFAKACDSDVEPLQEELQIVPQWIQDR